jgi:predicted ATP-grasp superfamily ATP-dependent carboligase
MAGGEDRGGAGGFSRYCRRSFTYPPTNAGLAATHAVVLDHVRRWRPDVLFPVFTHAWHVVYAFFEEYAQLTHVVPSPGRTLFDALNNKATLIDRAREHAVPMPVTYAPASHEEALALGHTLPYPVLLKPRKKWGGRGIRCVFDQNEFRRALGGFSEIPIIQERIEGDDLILNILCSTGEPLAASAYQVLRRHPLPYGPPVACRTIHDEALVRMGTQFLRRLQYDGVANLDIRRDRRDGSLKLLEVNPRLSETIEISVRSGINIPYMLYQLALGERVTPAFQSTVGLEFRWLLFGELLHLAQTKKRRRTLRELLAPGRVATNIVLTDPLPHLVEGLSLARRILGGWRKPLL